ncbi:MAG TPA: hypothetical protein VHP58_03650 [Alphaproteobacteria bacterium]|nr:hypothetical protein [Alphaproteobacteria bacterium]
MWRFTKAALAAVTLIVGTGTSVLAAGCSYERQENLLTTVFYREAVPTRAAHASVMSIILTRLRSGKYGPDICSVITYPNALVHTMGGGKVGQAKLALSRESARIFLREYAQQGTVSTESSVFERLRGMDSFHARSFRGAYASSCSTVIGDNCFYAHGQKRHKVKRVRHKHR